MSSPKHTEPKASAPETRKHDRSLDDLSGHTPQEVAEILHNDAVTRGGTVPAPKGDSVKDMIRKFDESLEPIATQPQPAKAAQGSAANPSGYIRLTYSHYARLVDERDAVTAELELVKQQHADSEEAVQILAKGGAEYRQQRDELLAALKAVLAAKQVGTILNHARAERDLYDAYKAARAAIAVAEGRAS